MRGQPKTHKTNIPIRPIVNFHNAPTYKMFQFLNTKIKSNLSWERKYSINNVYELIDKFKEVNIPDSVMFLSFYIENK